MFKTRLISGIFLVIAMIVFLVAGGPLLFVGVEAISLIGLFELYRVYGFEKKGMAFAGYLFTLWFGGVMYLGFQEYFLLVIIAYLLVIMAFFVFRYPDYSAEQLIAAMFGLIYVSVMLSFIYQLRMVTDGAFLVWLIVLSAWGCDTCAYCVGMLIGKKKLAPVLSPKKSVEGSIGGIVGAGVLGAVYGAVFAKNLTAFASPVVSCMVICAVGGAISQIGDLAASGIKRNKEIKDYGTLIPGHGGILDRFDSMIFTAPIIYYLVIFLQK